MTNLDKKALIDLAVPLARGVLPKLTTKAASPVINKFSLYSFRMKTWMILFKL